MLNNKRYNFFHLQKEQKYLKKLIKQTTNTKFYYIYEEFISLNTKEDLSNFANKYNLSDISNIENINEIKETLAYDLVEMILKG